MLNCLPHIKNLLKSNSNTLFNSLKASTLALTLKRNTRIPGLLDKIMNSN